jgi:hypothetical protein
VVVANISVCTMFRRIARGTRCDSAFNVPSESDLKMKQHTKVNSQRWRATLIPYSNTQYLAL